MIHYRTFQNSDPPRIRGLWNASVGARGVGILRSCDILESLIFSKPYFDPAGFFLALDGEKVVGFSHAGFGASDDKSTLDHELGAVYAGCVLPDYRRQGIGSYLLRLAQEYLRSHDVHLQYIGGMFPLNAFYVGAYGGSELPGILDSLPEVKSFARHHGYEPCDECLVYQRRLDELPRVDDTRIALLRRRVEVQAEPWPLPPSWWDACVLGNIPSLRYEMQERETQAMIGHAWVWEMECFAQATGVPTVGIIDFRVEPAFRRQGFAKLLLLTLMKHLREQQIERIELQTMATNDAARGLYEGLGFEKSDAGQAYRQRSTGAPAEEVSLSPAPRQPRTEGLPRFHRVRRPNS